LIDGGQSRPDLGSLQATFFRIVRLGVFGFTTSHGEYNTSRTFRNLLVLDDGGNRCSCLA
jgi:hypothetical protein